MSISVQKEDFDQGVEYQKLVESNVADGAIVTFVGMVRDFNQGSQVSGLHLEHYPAMTDKALAAIVNEAKTRWSLGRVRLIHRVGSLALGEQIVFVGVTSTHRQSAFDACQFMMDFLKNKAPFWKKEMTELGDRWVVQEEKEKDAFNRW